MKLSTPLTDAWRTMVSAADDPHGPLPPLLLALTVVTGLVDAFSYLVLGRVFVANMTGNVVFLGFALAGAGGFSIAASLVALGAFSLGALAGGRLSTQLGAHRGRVRVCRRRRGMPRRGIGGGRRDHRAPRIRDGPLHPHRAARPRHGHAERRGSQACRARPHHHSAHPHDHRDLRRRTPSPEPRPRSGAGCSRPSPCSWAGWSAPCSSCAPVQHPQSL